jgi:hypothetical protein
MNHRGELGASQPTCAMTAIQRGGDALAALVGMTLDWERFDLRFEAREDSGGERIREAKCHCLDPTGLVEMREVAS